jgi:Domain of Unknown Function (DUF1080)
MEIQLIQYLQQKNSLHIKSKSRKNKTMLTNKNFLPLFYSGVFFLLLLLVFGFRISSRATVQKAKRSADEFVRIFDGKSFKGWDGDRKVWRIENGSFVGEVTASKQIKTNSFLIWRGAKPGDFEFKAEYRISSDGNSGVNYRSEELKDIPYALKGYQADIDGQNIYSGQNYEERGRGFLAKRGENMIWSKDHHSTAQAAIGNADSLKQYIKVNDWNEVLIIAKKNLLKHYINGVLMSVVLDDDMQNRKMSGVIGLQVHVLPSMKVEYRNVFYKKI